MRIDVLLNKLCIVKTRSIAKKATDKEVIFINGKQAKASNEVKVGDIIIINMYDKTITIKIIKIPDGNVAKKDVLQYYEICNNS